MATPRCLAVVVIIAAASAQHCADPLSDNETPDHMALLSVRNSGVVQVVRRPGNLLESQSDFVTPQLEKGGKQAVPGVVFVKMIKVAGELFSSILAQYAMKRGWRVLQHKACSEEGNPLGQATCACSLHYIGPGELPLAPRPEHRYAALYTHMHYDPKALSGYMVPGAVKLVILRHPVYVLRSAHAMAVVQASHEKDLHIKDNFCQHLAHDGDAWRRGCEFVQTGQDSLLDYLDHDASERLRLLLAKPAAANVHEEAMAIVDEVSQRLETFVVGLQEEFDASMLLFERALGWSREDTLYAKHDSNSHSYHNNAAAKAAVDSWGLGTPRGDKIMEKLRRGPYRYHELLYQRAVAIHQKQMRKTLGSKEAVDAELVTYRAQLVPFTSCIHAASSHNVCAHLGLVEYSKARPHCAAVARNSTSEEAVLAEAKA